MRVGKLAEADTVVTVDIQKLCIELQRLAITRAAEKYARHQKFAAAHGSDPFGSTVTGNKKGARAPSLQHRRRIDAIILIFKKNIYLIASS